VCHPASHPVSQLRCCSI